MELEEIKSQLSGVNSKLNEIYGVLIGSEHDKASGFLSRVKDLENQVKKLTEFKKSIIYIAIGMSIPSTYGVFKIVSMVFSIVK